LSIPDHSFLDYEKSQRNKINFDKSRFCELENIIHLWKNEKSLSKKSNINMFRALFINNFSILDISYDFYKFYIFKVKLQAKRVGLVKRNKYTNFDIEIKPLTEFTVNETQCLGVLNINHLTEKVEIRLSTYVIFYFTDIYV
jgi:hypothetical protein